MEWVIMLRKMQIKIIGRQGLDLCSKCIFKYSLSRTKWVLFEADNATPGSSAQVRGRSFSASVPSEVTKTPKGRKRISKDERKDNLESFVNKYRSMNAGEFPTVSHAQKEVGGSYYVVKKIIQELRHNYTESSSKEKDQIAIGEEPSEEIEHSTEVFNESSRITSVENMEIQTKSQMEVVHDVEISVTGHKHLEAEAMSRTSSRLEKPLPKEFVEPTTPVRNTDIPTRSCVLEIDTKEASDSSTGKLHDIDSDSTATRRHLLKEKKNSSFHPHLEMGEDDKKLKSLPVKQQSEGSLPVHEFPTSPREVNDENVAKKSTFWGNLKSIADGIMDIWRKR